jgi:hypothetical protein
VADCTCDVWQGTCALHGQLPDSPTYGMPGTWTEGIARREREGDDDMPGFTALPTNTLTMWTIYEHPKDYPGKWVMRAHDIAAGSTTPRADCIVADSLDEVRAVLPPGLTRLPPHPDDDPVIHETWL